jgi:protein-disulfide isomerase
LNNGSAILIAATILGFSIIGGSYLLNQSIGQASAEISALGSAVVALKDAPAGGRAAAAPTRRPSRGPDPERVYEINLAGSPSRGEETAAITLVEFSDFQCPFCGRVTPTLKQIEDEYGEQVRIVFKHLPLSMHSKAPQAHAAAQAAANQGKFWEMHDLIFANQRELTEVKYIEYAGQLGLDVDQFKVDLASPETKRKVDADVAEAGRLGVTGTPGFFINGRFTSGAKPFAEFKRLIDAELERQS